MSAPTLWLVATPIGNLGDLTPRAVELLARSALICCEDTRRTAKLLAHAGLSGKRLVIANEHTEVTRVDDVLGVLAAGGDVALVTDAGTPGVSDPGEHIVRAVLEAGYAVSAAPGPTAAIMALAISGLPTARFVFEGFLPRSGRARRERLAELAGERRTIVLYEAPHRIERTIADLRAVCGEHRRVALGRELTKLHEEVVRGELGSITIGTPRGEYTVVLAGADDDATPPPDDDAIRLALTSAMRAGASKKEAISEVSSALAISKRRVYALAVELSSTSAGASAASSTAPHPTTRR